MDTAQGGLGGGAGDLGDAAYPVFGVGAALYGLFLLREETTSWGKGGGGLTASRRSPRRGRRLWRRTGSERRLRPNLKRRTRKASVLNRTGSVTRLANVKVRP